MNSRQGLPQREVGPFRLRHPSPNPNDLGPATELMLDLANLREGSRVLDGAAGTMAEGYCFSIIILKEL